MTKKYYKKPKKGNSCLNHPDIFDTKECERCHEHFCQECIVEDWSTNFFQQFIGQKRDFIKKSYCKSCQERVVRIRLIAYIGLLILFGGPIVLWLLSALLFPI